MPPLVKNLKDINRAIFSEAVGIVLGLPIIDRAPMGYRSASVLIHGDNNSERRRGVSVFNHSGMIKMLITDRSGHFIYHGGYDRCLDTKLIVNNLYRTYNQVKRAINGG